MMQKWKIWAGVFAVFCLGVAAGALGMQTYIKTTIVAEFQGRPRPPSEDGILGHLDREVGLKEEQKEPIRKIFAEMIKKMDQMSQAKHKEIEAAVAETDAAVAAQLDPAQREKFLAMVERMNQMRKNMPPPPLMGGPKGPPPPHPNGEAMGPPPFGPAGPPPGGPNQPPPPRSPQP
jgi:hypothetical protein